MPTIYRRIAIPAWSRTPTMTEIVERLGWDGIVLLGALFVFLAYVGTKFPHH
jgi:hypothetical protein